MSFVENRKTMWYNMSIIGERNKRYHMSDKITNGVCLNQVATVTYDQEIVRFAFELICSTKDVPNAIRQLLQQIGQKYKLDSISICEISTDLTSVEETYFWNSEKKVDTEFYKYLTKEELKEYFESFDENGFLNVLESINPLKNRKVIEFYENQGIQSVLHYCFYDKDMMEGFICFSSYRTKRWEQNDQISLMTIVKVLAHSILKIYLNDSMKKTLHHIKNFDGLTDLPTLHNFKNEVANILEQNKTTQFLIVYSDIKNFKYINENLGEEVADQILIEFAKHLLRYQLDIGASARIESDKFISLVLLDEEWDAVHIVSKINEEFRKKMKQQFVAANVVIMSGLCKIKYGMDISVCIDNANIARKSLKQMSQQTCRFFDQGMKDKLHKEIEITNSMEDALQNGEFVIYLQPKIDLSSDRIVGAEALVRWKKKLDEILPPDEFIPIFEKNGFILDLDYYVYEEVCKILKRWRENQQPIIPISVNVSRIHMNDNEFVSNIIRLVEKYDIPPELLELELTESIFLDNTNCAIDIIQRLREYGFSVSIDDFGAGYSSLNILKDMSTDVLKLDKEFFREGNMNQQEKIIISSIVNMAKQLNMKVLSEGIETCSQFDFLKGIQCDLAQGYLFSKPIPIGEFEEIMNDK